MTLKKRLERIETSLTPKQAVLLFLKEILELGPEGYLRMIWLDRKKPWELVSSAVEDAIRQSLKGASRSTVYRIVREAKNQADVLVLLIFNLHERVQSELSLDQPYEALLREQFRRMLREFGHEEKFQPEEWNSWRTLLIERLVRMRQLKETVATISTRHFDRHQLLFAAHEQRLSRAIVLLQELVKDYNSFAIDEFALTPIEIDAELNRRAKQLELQVSFLETAAEGAMLNDAGYTDAACDVINRATVGYMDQWTVVF